MMSSCGTRLAKCRSALKLMSSPLSRSAPRNVPPPRPERMFSSVVLPLPLWPSMAVSERGMNDACTSFSISGGLCRVGAADGVALAQRKARGPKRRKYVRTHDESSEYRTPRARA